MLTRAHLYVICRADNEGIEMIKIDKGVPVYEPERQFRYPWDQMEVGDSFFVSNRKPSQFHLPAKLVRKGWAITKRSENQGTRVWRTK